MKDSLRIVGFMSGTSMDGLDCCICDISIDEHYMLKYKIVDQKNFQFDAFTISQIKKNIGNKNKFKIDQIDNFLGKAFLDLSKDFLSDYFFDYISIHGQTIYHKDKVESIQVGNPSYLANYFKVPVIYDFRQKDIKLSGNGAPLMPFLDWLVFKNEDLDILTLNLGGISNISVITRNSEKDKVIGFDTGPGMSLIDECSSKFWNSYCDYNSQYSSKGKIDEGMLNYLMKDDFISKKPPKSTGREDFGKDYLNKVINNYSSVSKFDIIRTLVKFTSKSIKANLDNFILKNRNIDRLIISGGGLNHLILVNDIKKDLDIPIYDTIDYGIESQFKESLLMAVLGYTKIKNIESNMPSVTGALGNVVLGDICEPE